ncbi:MAG TPA: arsenate reductase family protein [Gammaproteobacteria bacterium]|nr:arsenate reductase family protein [Gammaproteobacteria bacterium]
MTDKITVYQKTTCSKCIGTLGILDERGIDYESVNYYEQPLTVDEFRELLRKLDLSARDVLRDKEPVATELRLAERDLSEDELMAVMVANPDLIQRPIVVKGDRAVLARPPETVESLLS